MLKDVSGLVLIWLGIVGAAVTLFAGLLAPLDMADWTWWLVQNWQEAAPFVWDRLAAGLGVEVPASLVPPLTMSVFLILTGMGVGLRERWARGPSVVSHPALQLAAALTALLGIGYVLLAYPSPVTSAGSVPPDAPLAIFLAGATVSFSPPIAGGGNLTGRLWFMLLGAGALLALNEFSKLALQLLPS